MGCSWGSGRMAVVDAAAHPADLRILQLCSGLHHVRLMQEACRRFPVLPSPEMSFCIWSCSWSFSWVLSRGGSQAAGKRNPCEWPLCWELRDREVGVWLGVGVEGPGRELSPPLTAPSFHPLLPAAPPSFPAHLPRCPELSARFVPACPGAAQASHTDLLPPTVTRGRCEQARGGTRGDGSCVGH